MYAGATSWCTQNAIAALFGDVQQIQNICRMPLVRGELMKEARNTAPNTTSSMLSSPLAIE